VVVALEAGMNARGSMITFALRGRLGLLRSYLAGFLFIVLAVPNATAQPGDVDWKLYGGAPIGGGESLSLCFYEANGIERQPDGHMRVWTKCLLKTELDALLEKAPAQIVDATAQKVARYYVPPAMKLPQADVNANDAMAITGYEEAANLGRLQPKSRIFYELNCSDRMLRELSITLNIEGATGSKNTPGSWSYIPPEGNAAALSKLLCS
jgi:hypothetical protein